MSLLRGVCWMLVLQMLCSMLLWSNEVMEAAESEADAPQAVIEEAAVFKVRGAGLLRNLSMRRQLYLLYDRPMEAWHATDIEDAAQVLISIAQGDGFLNATVSARVEQFEADPIVVEWDSDLDAYLDRSVRSPRVDFELRLGPRYFYEPMAVDAGDVLSVEAVEGFYYRQDYLLKGKRANVYTDSRFNSAGHNLRVHLRQLGYQDAVVSQAVDSMDRDTGAVVTSVRVDAGPLYRLSSVELEGSEELDTGMDLSVYHGDPYSDFLRQDIVQNLRRAYYSAGYANVVIDYEAELAGESDGVVEVVLKVSIEAGDPVRVESVRFHGNETVREPLLRSKVNVEEGDLLDPSKLQTARLQLSRLGVFDEVECVVEQDSDGGAKVHFELVELTPWELDLLAGWGSYEQLRGGVIAERSNAFGWGHRIRSKAVVSMKSFKLDAAYILPEVLNSEYTLSSNLFYLAREELTFDRDETGADLRLTRFLREYDVYVDTRYIFQRLRAEDTDLNDGVDNREDVRVGSVELRFNQNRRNDPLNPTEGYRLFGNLELANRVFGGQVDYQRVELGYSQSGAFDYDLIWHAALEHQVVWSFGDDLIEVPTNKLFYPGGDNSIRGYRRGQAAPRDAGGALVGARSTVLLNLELEQLLSESISVVAFSDSLAMTPDIGQYPFNEYLFSVGMGLRWKTLLGPVRLEYGYNLNPRQQDPDGTLHLTIGYPF